MDLEDFRGVLWEFKTGQEDFKGFKEEGVLGSSMLCKRVTLAFQCSFQSCFREILVFAEIYYTGFEVV